MGYAAGVGKTYRMLEEAQDLQARGVDVVIGYFEPHGRQETIAKTQGLELIPRRTMEYRGSWFEEMDTGAVLRRHPRVCLVDEFAHTNVPGSERAKRWEDVLILLEAGIDVITTMNIQHLESLTDQVWQITGVPVRETVPDWMLKQADEIVMVDLTVGALIHRLERGVVYPPEKATQALSNFFKEPNLVSLREMALRQTAHEVDARQEGQELELPANPPPGSAEASSPPVGKERFLIHVTDQPATALLIRRAWRIADYLKAECLAVDVRFGPRRAARSDAVERHLRFARDLHIETHILEGEDLCTTLIQFARRQQITHLFLLRPHYTLWQRIRSLNLIHDIVRQARDIQITIVADRRPGA
jgi:two-component system sensor histidine kinase KdpD